MDLFETLSELGYQPLGPASDGESAIEFAKRETPDLVLMDVHLDGEMDGIEAAEHIVETVDSAVIFLTARTDQATLDRAILTQPFGYLNKPFEPSELRSIIEVAHLKHRMELQLKGLEQWRATVMSTLGDAIFVTDVRDQIEYLNPAAEVLTGHQLSDAKGRPFDTVMPFLAGPRRKETSGLLTLSESGAARCTITGSDGEPVVIDYRADPMLGAQGQIEGRVVVCRDVTEKVRFEERLQLSDQILDGIGNLVLVYDHNARIIYTSSSINTLLGFPKDKVLGKGWLQLTGFDDDKRERISKYLARAAAGEIEPLAEPYEQLIRDSQGREHWILWRDSKGPGRTLVGIGTDITERKRSTEMLQAREERFALATRGAKDGLWDWNLVSGEVFFSPRWWEIVGEQEIPAEVSIEDWFSRIHTADRDQLVESLQLHLKGDIPHLEVEHRIYNKDGTSRWVVARATVVLGLDGEPFRIAGMLSDITERQATDRLTGLPNRTLFLDRLETVIERSHRGDETLFAVLFLELDRFKTFNDNFGYAAGDELLICVAERLQNCLDINDEASQTITTVARLTSSQFIILVGDLVEARDGIRVADRVQEHLSLPFKIGQETTFVTASIGIVPGSSQYQRAEELLRDAENALQQAKLSGGGIFRIFDPDRHAELVLRWETERDLNTAVGAGKLTVAYQPIVDLTSTELAGFEALARWPRADGSEVPPSIFIPIAESTGLVAQIGEYVLDHACRAAVAWQAVHPEEAFIMSVNLSVKQLVPGLVERVAAILQNTGLDSRNLQLEITESVMVDDTVTVIGLLEDLKDLGIRLALDDFGTGYCSLSHLHQMPVHVIKIDRSFVTALDEKENSPFIDSILLLANSLNLKVVAEGIETEEQYARLQRYGCGFGQGYLFSRPLAPEQAYEFFHNDRESARERIIES